MSNTTIKLTKAEQKQIRKRMNELKAKNLNNKSSTQSVIPYKEVFVDGICHVCGNVYSLTLEFSDTNYELVDFDSKNGIFASWCNILNYFDESIDFQFSYDKQRQNINVLLDKVKIEEQEDDFNIARQEYSNMLCDKLRKSDVYVVKRLLTFSVKAKSLKTARKKLNSIANELIQLFAEADVKATILNGKERLEVLYRSLNPFSDNQFLFDWQLKKKAGYSTKDFIAPTSMKFKKNNFEIGNGFGQVVSLSIIAGELTDRFLMEYMKMSNQIAVNIHIKSFQQNKAVKYIKGKLSNVEKMKIDEQKKASQSGYDTDILPEDMKMYISELGETLSDLNSHNERLFKITITIRYYAETAAKLTLLTESLKRITQKNSCELNPLDYLQEQSFASSLPLCSNEVPIERVLPTSSVAVFIPFASDDLMDFDGTYFGINSISGKVILADRAKLKNPNGVVLGTPGSGKSFTIKREILDRFLKTTADIIINDPEGEYYPLVNYLGGQVIQISSSSTDYVNPMDVDITSTTVDDVISTKSDFLISLCELVVGRYRLTGEERSVIDLCTRKLYNRFFDSNPTLETMPLLSDLYNELSIQGDIAKRVANSLEMYVNGSQNLFNHRTNIDTNNRLICYDIKELGTQLKKIAMLIIQDSVWNRVSMNRKLNKKTYYYIDEFHLLLRDEETAKYSVEMWKRFRKWNGVPTGITQNVKDLLSSQEIENILDNSDYICMLNQSAGDRYILQEKLHLSDEQIKYVTNSGQGKGLIRFGKTILPFEDRFPKDTLMYALLTTKPEEKKLLEEKLAELKAKA